MIRPALQFISALIVGSVTMLLIVLFGFFVSPSAVRTTPHSANAPLLLEHLVQKQQRKLTGMAVAPLTFPSLEAPFGQ